MTDEELIQLFVVGVLLVVVIAAFYLPTIFAAKRKHPEYPIRGDRYLLGYITVLQPLK